MIDTEDGYRAALERIVAATGPVAIDAERASGFKYSQRAYLIQLYRRDAGTFLFDPPAIGDFSELNRLLAGEEWVLHAATQDLPCLREVGIDPQRLFDTELAARLLGMPRVGLATVVEQLLGIHLKKEHSAADWSTRPLPQPWLEYAALDVELLLDLRDELEKLLTEQRKRGIADQEFASTLARDLRTQRAEPWRRLSGVHAVRSPRNLAVARSLWTARDEYAREIDIAPGRLVPDASIVAVARALPKTRQELAALKEFSGRASRSQLDRWWEAVQAGLQTQELPAQRANGDSLPPPRAWSDRNPEADRRLKRARNRLTEIAEALGLPLENLLTPETLRRLAWQPPEPLTAEAIASALAVLDARPWQVAATHEAIFTAFVEANQGAEDAESDAS
ncbi:HRDC domain-containing protein [Ruicaihuangia caeni]|uniref:HRDC domain-containing protein n=1 Tax=Ruicaihuangia caeni TaxID=3042517 RepID=UPI00338F8C36